MFRLQLQLFFRALIGNLHGNVVRERRDLNEPTEILMAVLPNNLASRFLHLQRKWLISFSWFPSLFYFLSSSLMMFRLEIALLRKTQVQRLFLFRREIGKLWTRTFGRALSPGTFFFLINNIFLSFFFRSAFSILCSARMNHHNLNWWPKWKEWGDAARYLCVFFCFFF